MNIDEQLRAALRREPAPKDFAAAVLAQTCGRAGAQAVRNVHRGFWRQRPFALALAAVIAAVAIVPAVVLDYQRREEAKGLKAKQDLLTALAITREQLRHARDEVQHRQGERQ